MLHTSLLLEWIKLEISHTVLIAAQSNIGKRSRLGAALINLFFLITPNTIK